jgi:hypothetical protein
MLNRICLLSIISIVGILWRHERNPWIISFDRQSLSYALNFWATLGLYVVCILFLYRKFARCTFNTIYKNSFRTISLDTLTPVILAMLFCVDITDLFIRSTPLSALISDGDTFTNYLPCFNQMINKTFGFPIDNNFHMYHGVNWSGLQAYMMLLSDISFGTAVSFLFVCGMLAVLFRILYRQGVPSSLFVRI